jgi:hypothetical protein
MASFLLDTSGVTPSYFLYYPDINWDSMEICLLTELKPTYQLSTVEQICLVITDQREKMELVIDKFLMSDHRYFNNSAPCGLGKTTKTAEVLMDSKYSHILWIVPQHMIVEGKNNLEEILTTRKVSFLHLYPKTFPNYCFVPDELKYFPGCQIALKKFVKYVKKLDPEEKYYELNEKGDKMVCKFRNECQWRKQWQLMNQRDAGTYTYQFVLATYDMYTHAVNQAEQGNSMFNCIVYDESPEQRRMCMHSHKFKPTTTWPSMGLTPTLAEDPKDLGAAFKFYDCVYDKKKLKVVDDFTKKLQLFLESTQDIHLIHYPPRNPHKATQPNIFGLPKAKVTNPGDPDLSPEENGHDQIFGTWAIEIPEYPKKIFFNCATTDPSVMSTVFDVPVDQWEIYKPTAIRMDRLINPVAIFPGSWGNGMTHSHVEMLDKLLWHLNRRFQYHCGRSPRITVITKQFVEQKLKKKYEKAEIHFVHYNAGRGFNTIDQFGEADLVIMYGRFGFTPLNRELYTRVGYTQDQITAMEHAEMLQCLHRARPLLHPAMPILFMTDTDFLAQFFTKDEIAAHKYNKRILDDFVQDREEAINITDPITVIMEKLGGKSTDRHYPTQFRNFLNWIQHYMLKK